MLGKRIQSRRKALKLNQEELAESIGVVRQTISSWENGAFAPEGKNLERLADSLKTSVAYLMGETDDPSIPIKKASSESNGKILRPPQEQQPPISIGSSWKALPLYSQMTSACAGIGNGLANADAEIDSWHYFPEEIYGRYHEETPPYMVHVEGDSMEDANIHDGAVAIINPAEEVFDGEAALVCWNRDQVAIKIIYWLPDGGVELHSANQEHKKIYTFSRDDVMEGHLVIKGKVMWSGQRPKRLR